MPQGPDPDPQMPRIPSQAWSWSMTHESDVPPTPVFPGLHDGGWLQGAPIGGFGTGGIGRDIRGGFGRRSLKAGCLKHVINPADMFALRVCPQGGHPTAFALHPGRPTARADRAGSLRESPGLYTAYVAGSSGLWRSKGTATHASVSRTVSLPA